jgi:hypothetical protein
MKYGLRPAQQSACRSRSSTRFSFVFAKRLFHLPFCVCFLKAANWISYSRSCLLFAVFFNAGHIWLFFLQLQKFWSRYDSVLILCINISSFWLIKSEQPIESPFHRQFLQRATQPFCGAEMDQFPLFFMRGSRQEGWLKERMKAASFSRSWLPRQNFELISQKGSTYPILYLFTSLIMTLAFELPTRGCSQGVSRTVSLCRSLHDIFFVSENVSSTSV